ncbi:MAG: electron transport complex subunit E [Methanocellales archaeon]|nr:electron transport complex subunit E [Methanocellales archaeon]MDD3292018.1 electron transport complex subunit E [Methanocellales archaeon]MDD5235699.1 electron transport complex subunit E [Methanocellales archaeon]MDD5485625.1 electron transport complex subunit E [Methanocellales archaeon]
MNGKPSLLSEFTKGIIKNNAVFCLVLGICPTLAVTTSFENGLGMGLAFTFVLLGSNLFISLLRNQTPPIVRLPIFIVIIATFVTIIDIVLQAYLPPLYEALGIFVPLIVVNCIVIGRAEAYASKNPVLPSIVDALGISVGYILVLMLIGGIRELLGTGKITFVMLWLLENGQIGFLELATLHIPIEPATVMVLPPGAFFTIGSLMFLFQFAGKKMSERRR